MKTIQPMMDKKSANGLQTKVSEGEVQRKQLPYSVETPYGFHLDLDFLKYVDDIEKGNTIKRVHIQRRLKGPPKFSTLPRNFSLPGHGARPVLKEKEIAWTGTSTLGPKPKSRLTEVQQVLDFRGGEGGNSLRGSTGQGYVSLKPKEEGGVGTQGVEEKALGLQGRPNLLRASSMPVTLQQRKGSDSSSPDRVTGTPENGSTENMFRASPDITERRVPHDRIGLHQQITVALKRVRELEEQVKTIPELKAQIASLRSEREQLLRQLQAQAQALVSASPPLTTSGSDTERQTQSQRSKQGFNLPLVTTSTGDVEVSEADLPKQPKEVKDATEESRITAQKDNCQETSTDSSAQGRSQEQLIVKTDSQEVKPPRRKGDVCNNQDANTANKGTHGDPRVVQGLKEQLKILEDKLSHASQELERANHLLKEQMAENKLKEDKIQLLSEGLAMEVCREAQGTPRRESIDAGTVTEKVDFTHRETETEPCGTVDQGTDTDRICIEVRLPQPGAGLMEQVSESSTLSIAERQIDIEVAVSSPPRPRANSMERGTVTERVATQDQTTETPVTERVNQVTETEDETVNNHPHRPRASSVDRGTETERVRTMDRVTETEVAQRSNQQTETEVPHDNNPARETVSEEVTESARSQQVNVHNVVGEQEEGKTMVEENVVGKVVTEILVDDKVNITDVSDTAKIEEGQRDASVGQDGAIGDPRTGLTDSETKENIPPESVVTEPVEKKPVESEIVRATIKETVVTDTVVITAESPAVKTVVPVRPQRGRRPSGEQGPPTLAQPQPAPVRPRRGSSENQGQQPKPESKVQVQEQKVSPQAKTESLSQTVGDKSPEKIERQPPTDIENKREIQTLPKSVQAQTSTTRRNSKELKALQKGSSVSLPSSRGSGGNQTRPARQGSSEVQPPTRRKSSESQPPTSEAQSLRRGSSEAGQRRGSGESQASRRGSGESPTSPAALGQVVTRLTGLLGEQWAQLGSSSGVQQTVSQQETPGAQKQTAGKRAEASKGASAKPAGKSSTVASGKPAGKPGPSKMSSIQSQLVSSLSVLSAFYSPAQKAAAANKQQEQGLKSIMKKNGSADKPGSKGAKKNLKFVGVNGGYETTSSEESSGDEKAMVAAEQEEDSSEPEVEKESEVQPEEGAEMQKKEEGAEDVRAVEKESERGLLEPERSQELLEELAEGGKVDKGFIDACLYVKDRMEEVSSPDKEMRQVLVVLYQEWFKVSSQKDSQADTVRLYLRQVGLTTPTLLPYVVNLTDGNGNMALHYSVSHSNFSVVKLLLDTGLCEADNINKAGYTPVMLAALTPADSPDDLEVVQQLLKLGDVNARSRQTGQTALMLAVSHGRLAMVKLLLSCGADVNAQDREGSTALMCASEHGHTHIASLLLETGCCDLSLTDQNGQTAQAVAEEASHQDIVDLMKSNAKTQAS
ncbi:KN motif and ankyrin repeat domain-containing protein 4 isoform X2 [Synchiropus splendidus]|uniref:KN motif and ankyrin repeat domain-containing protein 4 isoform X2 n=1 Tax=Synchiropus splendidus TaxID=270530 RepID=UPI00237E177C|nr:KN motif and ankyrin repeat domain-containing protein 4 isoform X2 [Synchiropus splendidus]